MILPSSSLLYVILALLYMQICRSVKLERALMDRIDDLNNNNCDGISRAFSHRGRCLCDTPGSSIVSIDTNQISCIRDKSIDISKY